MMEWKSKAINRAFSIMKPFHPTDETTALRKPEFMNPPHSAGLGKELQTGDSTYIHSQLGTSLARRGRCGTDTSVSNAGRKRRDGSDFPGVVTPPSHIQLNLRPRRTVIELSPPGSPTRLRA